MPRPVSWLPRLHEIRRSIASSVRSHYGRGDIQRIFELQPRAAQKLLEILPGMQVGTARLVDREVLTEFLDTVRNSDDPSSLFQQLRVKKAPVSKRKPRSLIRSLIRHDLEPTGLSSLPSSIRLERGRMEVEFRTVEELVEAMYCLAKILQDDDRAFVEAFEPAQEMPEAEPDDFQAMFSDLEAKELKEQAS